MLKYAHIVVYQNDFKFVWNLTFRTIEKYTSNVIIWKKVYEDQM